MSDDSKSVVSGAMFSDCRRYRYQLWRIWKTDWRAPPCLFIMLNPSTADEVKNDPTVERCERYARHWGHGALVVCNIFAYRATDPRDMKAQDDPIGPENNWEILRAARANADRNGRIVVAWGTHGSYLYRGKAVLELLSDYTLHALKVTKDGHPGHPLYLRSDATPIRYP